MAEEKQPSYLEEMLKSQTNVYAFLTSLAAGAALSIPFGPGLALVPLVAFAAGEALAALYVPSMPGFRAKVDKRWRDRARQAARWQLLDEIRKRTEGRRTHYGSLDAYNRMVERVQSLYRFAGQHSGRLSLRDVERLDDSTLDYLGIWLSALVIDDRASAVNLEEITRRIRELDRDIQAGGADVRPLEKARADYLGLQARHRRMINRKRSIEAAMLSMPDQVEEIYQSIVSAPTSSGLDSRLEESIARLSLEEDIEAELSADLGEATPLFTRLGRQKETQARPQPQRQGQTQ